MSRMKIKKNAVVGLQKPDVPYEPASTEDIQRYSRIQRRWGYQHLRENGLKLANPSDIRVIQFLDMYHGKLEQKFKAEKKALKKKIRHAKFKVLFALIFVWPLVQIKRLLRKVFHGKAKNKKL